MKVAIYIRVSKGDQTTENQKFDLQNYVKARDIDVYKWYEDVVSGAKDSRPQLDQMLQDGRKRLFSHVIFWKIDRLGRNALHTQQIVEEWRKHNISFTITTLDIDTSTPAGKFIFGIFAQFAEMERAMIIERTQTSMNRIKQEIAKKGYYITKEGKRITTLGRPKGKRDKATRKKRGYYLRNYKERSPRKNAEFYNKNENL